MYMLGFAVKTALLCALLINLNFCLSISNIFNLNNKVKYSKFAILVDVNSTSETNIKASKAYFLVESSKFWSLNNTNTQVMTKSPTNEPDYIVVNAPSIGIEGLVFIKIKNKYDKHIYSNKVSSFIFYTLECTKLGKNQGWILKKSNVDIAFGFPLDETVASTNYCLDNSHPHQVSKWFNSVNFQIKDMAISQLWFS
ncbi:hypothetical protein FG386_002486 [Cryptosporidium ryanae]|uniref:uncharacterized protein n=1 Tax=Cryptosporidium ryanae TaxID=515981 RepID=UPI00351A568C|nr:hypothetical protein FG386_002486 [Cryptosporidium ryanae]